MEGYGYSHQKYSTYKTEEQLGPGVRRPFVPFVPNSNRNSEGYVNPEGYVTRKTVVPVATRPYADDYSTHGSPPRAYYGTHGSPPRAYSTRDDDEYLQKQKVDDFLIQVRNEGSRPHSAGSPVRNDNYYGNGYGNYDTYYDKERRKPIGSGIRNDNYDRYQPGDTYSSLEPNRNSANSGWSRPSSGWTPPPRNGTHLSEPTSEIGKALGLLKEAAKVSPNAYGDYRRPKDEGYYYREERPNSSIWADPPGNGGSHHVREPSKVNKAVELAKEAERLKSLKNKLVGEPTKSHNGDYYYRSEPGESTDPAKRRGDQWRHGNIIDSWEAQKKYNGARV